MDTTPHTPEAYPLTASEEQSPAARLSAYLAATAATPEARSPFQQDLATLISQYHLAAAHLGVIAAGHFSSTSTEPQYAGGSESEGNRIFTPAEGARNALDQLEFFDKLPLASKK